jgi:aerobic carbon-monoxide dehydrogenase large subunit
MSEKQVPRPEDQPHITEESDVEGFQAQQVQLPEPEQAPAATGRGIGTATLRKEDAEFITGQGRYVDDVVLPGLQHLSFVRSPHAHADITSIDTSAALQVSGVTAVLTHEDLHFEGGVPCGSNPTGDAKQPERPPLARGKVRMVGEPVAVVVAETRYAAADGAAAVEVDYEPLAAVSGVEAAVEDGAAQVHDDVPDNLCCSIRFETESFDEAVDEASVVVEQRVVNQRLTPVAIEPRGVIAQYVPASDEVTLYTSTQVPHFVRTFVAVVCGISEAKVRVIAPDVGGGFGSKLNTYAEEYVAVAVSKALGGTPVKWTESRSENMLATTHGRDHVQYAKLYAGDDGTIVGLDVHVLANMGAYLQLLGPSIPHLTLFMAPGLYDIPNYRCRIDCIFTNTTPTDAYRGAGRPEATHLIERLVDILARRLELDPVEVREKNFAREFPFTTATGLQYDSGDYEKPLARALELVDYEQLKREREEAKAQGRLFGVGFSTYVEVCGLAPSSVTKAIGIGAPGWESSTLRLHPTGKATVVTGTSPHGQGHATSWSQIVESELGVPFDDVEVIHGDTAFAPYGLGTYGSRSLAVGGTALYKSIEKVKDKARKIAAHTLEASPDDLEWEAGRFYVKGSPDRGQTIQDVIGAAWAAADLPEGVEPGLEETTFFDPPNFTFPFGCHVCVTEVDPETGKVEIKRYVAVDDCGRVINPMIVDGQIHGGIAQSIGQALFEETVYDEDGQCLTTTLVDYMIPTAMEIPRFETDRTETLSPTNPLGVKGIGEAGTIAATAAIVNSVCDALDVEHIDMPLQPERVWRVLQGMHEQRPVAAAPMETKGGGAS